jgi:hypothetical protein
MKELKRLLLLAYDFAGDTEVIENLLIKYAESGELEKAKGAQISRDYVTKKLNETLTLILKYHVQN